MTKYDRLFTLPVGSQFRQWKVVKKLGEGSFGAVYQVANTTTDDEHAMKVEATSIQESMIKMEVAVLKSFRNSPWPHPHACDYIDSGETLSLRFVVMKLCGPNLSDLRQGCPRSRFTENTTIRLGIQCIRSIEALHRIGFIHRDIKPPNYAIGTGYGRRTVILLDYGLARQYVDKHGQLRPPRRQVGFRGTVRYASLNAHLKQDLGRQDDLWSLLYMLIEVQKGKLPWRKTNDKEKVGMMKREAATDELFKDMAHEFHVFQNELQGLQFKDTPDYELLCQLLRSIMERKNYQDDAPYDWEKGGAGYDKLQRARIVQQPYKTQKEAEKMAKKEHDEEEEESRLSDQLFGQRLE